MEEWEMARWRSRARLHFLGTLHAPELEYRYLGGQKEIFENGVRILESLGILNPPRATDMRLSKLGQDGGTRDSYRRVWRGWTGTRTGADTSRGTRCEGTIVRRISFFFALGTLMESGCADDGDTF
jgi:hypothetical protein